MKKLILCLMVWLSVVSAAEAKEEELDITFDVTYVTRYIDKGFDCYDDKSGIQPSLDIDLYNTGFGLNVGWFRANSSEFENAEKLDYRAYYYNSLFDGETYALDYRVSWIYHHFPDNPKKVANSQEIEAEFEWPHILSCGVIPRYIVSVEWPAGSGYENRNEGGWVHLLGIGYGLKVPGIKENGELQVLNISADLVYNDGTGANCKPQTTTGVDQDWSHAVFGVSTAWSLCDNMTLTPGAYYQISMEDSVNSSDEYWFSFGLSYNF
jgi:hypothetical protein